MKRLLVTIALITGLAAPVAVTTSAQAAPQRACGSHAVLVSHDAHHTTVRKDNTCGYWIRAYIASPNYGYIFGNKVTALGALSTVRTTLNGGNRICWGYQTAAGTLYKLAGTC